MPVSWRKAAVAEHGGGFSYLTKCSLIPINAQTYWSVQFLDSCI